MGIGGYECVSGYVGGCRVCQFLWCKYSHRGQFQAGNRTSLKAELGSDSQGRTVPHHFRPVIQHVLRYGTVDATDLKNKENSKIIRKR